MFKIAGCICVISACSGFGILKAMELNKRIVSLFSVKRLLLHLRGEIHYSKSPLIEAFSNMAVKERGAFSSFCTKLSEELGKLDGRTFEEIWRECIDSELAECGLHKSDLLQFGALGARLGYLDYEMQLSTIDMEVERLEEQLYKLGEAVLQKQRIYRALGVFSGLMIAILFM